MADDKEQGGLPDAVKALARKALGLPPSYVSTESPAGPMLSYEEPALKIDRAQTDSSDALPNAANSNARADVIEIKPALFDVAQAMDLIAEIERLNGDSQVGLTDELQKLKQYVQSAIKGKRGADIPNLGDIATKVAAAKAEATSKDETPQQKVDRLWGEFDKASAKADKILEKLPLTDEQKKQDEETKKELEEARKSEDPDAIRNALMKRIKFLGQTADEHNSLELREAVKELEKIGKPLFAATEEKRKQDIAERNQAVTAKVADLGDAADKVKESDLFAKTKVSLDPNEKTDLSQSGQLSSPQGPVIINKDASISTSFD